MQIVNKIAIDLQRRQILPQIDATQNDTLTRAVKVALYNGGSAWAPPEGTTVSLAFHKPDGTSGWYDNLPTGETACIVYDNEVMAVLAPQVLTVPGKVKAAVVFQDAGLKRLTAFPFYIMVEADPAANALKSEDYYNLQDLEQLNEAVGDLQEQVDRLWTKVDAVNTKITEGFKPSFEKVGKLIQVCPFEGSSLALDVDDASFNMQECVVHVCGKNLYDKNTHPCNISGYPVKGSGGFLQSENYRRTSFISVAHLRGQTITLNHAPVTASNPGMTFYTYIPDTADTTDCKAAYCGGGTGANTKVPDTAVYMCFSVATENADKDLQIELGGVSTDYEPYTEKYLANYNGEIPGEVTALPGINTVFCLTVDDDLQEGAGVVTVTGTSDLKAEIRRLTEYINALLGVTL